MKKILKQLFYLIILIFILVSPYFVFVQPSFTIAADTTDPVKKLEEVGVDAGPFQKADELSFAMFLGIVVTWLLSLLGIIFIGLIIYAGYNWMTAGGEEEKVNKAKNTIKNSIIGLVITLSAYIIWDFIAEKLLS